MNEEVRFGRMIPDEIVRRRDVCPVAYLPVGALEWHGEHLPFGTDYLTVEHISERAALQIGGVAFPPLLYGDVRYNLQDSRSEWRDEYTREMRIPRSHASAFPLEANEDKSGHTLPVAPDIENVEEPLPFSPEEQNRCFVRLIAQTLLSIYLYGFKVIILLPGHGPNTGPCQQAEQLYAENAKRRQSFQPPAVTKTFLYIEVAKEIEPRLRKHWIHADKWESSIMLAAAPETVHLDRLPKDKQVIPPAYLGIPYLDEHTGYSEAHQELWENFGALDPRNANADYGKEHIDYVIKRLGEEVNALLKERD